MVVVVAVQSLAAQASKVLCCPASPQPRLAGLCWSWCRASKVQALRRCLLCALGGELGGRPRRASNRASHT